RLDWNNGTMNCVGGSVSGAVYATNYATLNVAASFGAQTIRVGGNCYLGSAASQLATIWVQGNPTFGGATLIVPAGQVNNAGTIRLESVGGSYGAGIGYNYTGGPGLMVNSAMGVIQAYAGTGGWRSIGG